MHEIKAFKTNDGMLFDKEIRAAEHELTSFIRKWWDEATGKAEMMNQQRLVNLIMGDVDPLAQALNTYIRARGPVKVKSTAKEESSS